MSDEAVDSAEPVDPDFDPEATLVALNARELLKMLAGDAMTDGPKASAVIDPAAEGEARARERRELRRHLLEELEHEPHAFGFFQAVRQLENAHPELPRIGTSLRLRDDPIRFAQSPSLSFAPATLARFSAGGENGAPTLTQRFFGLFGANGPLPLHLTEFARERARRTPSDRALVRFLDMFHHRLLSLFYRAWAEAQPTVSLDRPQDDSFGRWVASVAGYGQASLRDRDAVPDGARLASAGILGRAVHGAEGFERMLNDFFRVPIRVLQWQPHWMRLPEDAHSRLGSRDAPARLGESAVAGSHVWDCHNRFRIEIGPLALADYQRFLPGGDSMKRLRDWVLSYVGHELSCEVRLILKKEEVPAMRLGGRDGALGWTSWVGPRRDAADAGDLCLRVT
jgi:type VI secretion system protein ImpH